MQIANYVRYRKSKVPTPLPLPLGGSGGNNGEQGGVQGSAQGSVQNGAPASRPCRRAALEEEVIGTGQTRRSTPHGCQKDT